MAIHGVCHLSHERSEAAKVQARSMAKVLSAGAVAQQDSLLCNGMHR